MWPLTMWLFVCVCAAQSIGSRTGYACEGSTLQISCPAGLKIRIDFANYGRLNQGICNDLGITEGWDLQCSSTRALGIVVRM